MTARLLAWSARHPWLVLAIALLAAGGGEICRRRLARDAIPDLSDPQIVLVAEWMGRRGTAHPLRDAIPDLSDPQIVLVAEWMGRPATAVAEKLTRVITEDLAGMRGVRAIRGTSMSGMSFVDVAFERGASLQRGRAEILERVNKARSRLPPDARVTVGPEASSTGWVYEYVIADSMRWRDPAELRRFQDDIVRPELARVPGVVEVASVGGAREEVVVQVQPERLAAAGMAFSDLVPVLRSAA